MTTIFFYFYQKNLAFLDIYLYICNIGIKEKYYDNRRIHQKGKRSAW